MAIDEVFKGALNCRYFCAPQKLLEWILSAWIATINIFLWFWIFGSASSLVHVYWILSRKGFA